MTGLLLDENLPEALVLPTRIPVRHVRMLGVSPSDSEVWERARSERWVVVSKDADFLHRALVSAPPPWVVHVRLGNVRLPVFQELLAGLWPRVEAEFPEAKVVSVFHDRLEVIR